MKNKIFNVLIVGCGRIGAFFDKPKDRNVLTHAHAFSLHKGFNLVGFIDSDFEQAKKAASVWGGQVFKNIDEAFKNNKIDIVCNAAPDKFHFQILKEILKYKPRLILAEKPLTATLKEAKKIMKLAKKNKIEMAVNYRRRFVPEFKKIKKDIKNGKYGEYLTGNGYYTKGIVHNGSHAIDLLLYFVGNIKKSFTLANNGGSVNDPQITTAIEFNNKKKFFLQNINHNLYTIFELDLLFSKARIRIINSGFKIEIQKIKDDKIFKGYRNMEYDRIINTSLNKSLYFAADNIYKHLSGGEELDCSLKDEYQNMLAAHKIAHLNERQA